uniref:SHR-BD domain-containing protein n=1 Tax=Macrostomum lignano TaxID=282301 RepID=A0A1I8HNZ2_9PLAT
AAGFGGIQSDITASARASYSCDVELVVLDDTIQITNLEDKPMRLEATSTDKGFQLVSSDQWQQKFVQGTNTYRIFRIVSVELKVMPTEVSIRPVMRNDSAQVMIWKIKPVLYTGSRHLMERQVFSGRHQKTVNFDRAPGKYFRIRVATGNSRNSKLGIDNRSNIAVDGFQLLSLRIEAERVLASNLSGRSMEAAITTLRRRLTEDVQALPLNGVYCFSILPDKSTESKNLLCIRITEQSVQIEPYSKFGTVPLICDVSCPGRSADEPLAQILSGEVRSELQLPRRSYRATSWPSTCDRLRADIKSDRRAKPAKPIYADGAPMQSTAGPAGIRIEVEAAGPPDEEETEVAKVAIDTMPLPVDSSRQRRRSFDFSVLQNLGAIQEQE